MIIGMMKNSLPVYMGSILKSPLDTRGNKGKAPVNYQNTIVKSTFYNVTSGNSDIEFLAPLAYAGILKTGGSDVAFDSVTFSLKREAGTASGNMMCYLFASDNHLIRQASTVITCTNVPLTYTDTTFTFKNQWLFRTGQRLVVQYLGGQGSTHLVDCMNLQNANATATSNYSLTTAPGTKVWTNDAAQSPIMTVDT